MVQKPKTRGAPDKRSTAAKQKAQSARFIEAAREVGVDETGRVFHRAIKKLVKRKRG